MRDLHLLNAYRTDTRETHGWKAMVNTMAFHHGWYDRARAGFGAAITTSLGPAATLVLIVDGRVGNMNDNEPLTIEEREQLERFRLPSAVQRASDVGELLPLDGVAFSARLGFDTIIQLNQKLGTRIVLGWGGRDLQLARSQ